MSTQTSKRQEDNFMGTKKKSWKKIVGVVLFIVLNVAVIGATAANEFLGSNSAAELRDVNLMWWLIIPAILFFIISTIANVYKYVLMIRNSFDDSGKKPSRSQIWKIAWRVVMLGKYYDNVTPAAIGGQPFQIYYMRKNSDLSAGHATSIPIFGMITGQIGFLVLAIPCFIVGTITGFRPGLMMLAWFGLLFYAFWPLMVAGVSYFPKQTTKFLQFLTKILARLRIVKNREVALKKIESEVKEYAASVHMIMQTRGLFTNSVILSVVFQATTSVIPYFVLTAFGGNMDFLSCFMTTMVVTSSVYFVPTPGNAGAAEGTFYLVFSSLSTGYVFWAMLMWRFFSYYIYVIIGPLIYLKMHLENRKKKPDEHKKM